MCILEIAGLLATPILATTGAGGLAIGTTAATASAAFVGGGTTLLTVGGALAGTALVAGAAVGGIGMYKSARASSKAEKAQSDAIKKLSENTGSLGVSKTAGTLQENTSANRTLSSLRISMLPQATTNDDSEVTQNVYGVDTNPVTTSTSNMTGLNIAA